MQKILKKVKIPIVIKLTVIYSSAMLAVIVLIGITTYSSLNWYIKDSARQAVQLSKKAVEEYLHEGGKTDKNMLSEVLLQYGVSLRVYDENKKLLFAGKADEAESMLNQVASVTAKYMVSDATEFEKLEKIKRNKDNNYYMEELTWREDGEKYKLIFLKSLLAERLLLNVLLICMSIAAVVGLLIAIVVGYCMSRKILHPIRQLTLLSKDIDINRLEQRIDINGIDDELHELAENFNHMLNRVHEGNIRQQQFVADASHELRTPITVIAGYAEMLANWGKSDSVVLEEGLTAIKDETEQIKELIDKLLLLAKSDRGQLVIKKEPLQVAALFSDLLKESKIYAQGKYCYEITTEVPVEFCADGAMLKQALRILLDNSRKYSSLNSVIVLKACVERQCLVISVQDEGCGISEEDLPYVFERFYRADKARNSETGGTGLGLAIAKEIINRHNGKVSIESRIGYGTKVSFYLPLVN